MSSKEQWFRNYERLYNEREAGEIDGTDEELSELAMEQTIEQGADKADQSSDRQKEHGGK